MNLDACLRTLSTYLAACEARQTAAITACFAPDARVLDPLGRHEGIEAVGAYFDAIYRDLAALSFETGPVCWCDRSCALSWKGAGLRHDGSAVVYQGVDVFTFGPNAGITELWAFWSPEELLRSDNVG